MPNEKTQNTQRDHGGNLIASVLILLGVAGWWDTTTMADPDSFVFPRMVIIIMVVFCLMLIVFNMARPMKVQGGEGGKAAEASTPRRLMLIAAMLAGAFAMPVLGFFISGMLVFFALIGIAMYDPWTRFRVIVYPIAAIAIVAGFYFIFTELLQVPLPVGALFE